MEPSTAPSISASDSRAPKKSTGLIAGMVACVVLAVGGIAFGVYGLTQAGNQPSATTPDYTSDVNPIISAELPNLYTQGVSAVSYAGGSKQEIDIYIRDGDIERCDVMSAQSPSDDVVAFDRNCQITGLTGKIYKVVELARGQATGPDHILAFIMTDGSVAYLSLLDAFENSDFSIKGRLKIDGSVRDALKVSITNADSFYGGGTGAVFVLSDGTFVEYDESML